jgi:hypothetical protein
VSVQAPPLTVRPITLRAARRFVGEHHRHSLPPRGWLFGCALIDPAGEVRGVGIASRPNARGLDDGRTVEIARVCTLGDRNACSRIYGALCRAAAALGYERAVTYTRADEPGTSPRAAGFTLDAQLDARAGWWSESLPRYTHDLFGAERVQSIERIRWARRLA